MSPHYDGTEPRLTLLQGRVRRISKQYFPIISIIVNSPSPDTTSPHAVPNVVKVRSRCCSVRSMNAAVSSAAKSGPCHVTAQVAGRGGGGGKYGGQVGTRMRSQSGERYNQIGVIWSLQHRTNTPHSNTQSNDLIRGPMCMSIVHMELLVCSSRRIE